MRIFREPEAADQSPRAANREPGELERNLAGVKAVAAVASAKGGSGKSALTVNLACALALAGRKVAILDCDLNAPSIASMLGLGRLRASSGQIQIAQGPLGIRVASSELLPDDEPPLISFFEDEPAEPAHARKPREVSCSQALWHLLSASQFGALDLLLIDLPPGMDQLYLLAKMVPSLPAVLVTQPSRLAVQALHEMLKAARESSIRILGVIENMAGFSCTNCRSVRPLFRQGDLAPVAQDWNVPIMARLPFDPQFAEASDGGLLFTHDHPDAPLAKQLKELAQRVDRAAEAANVRDASV
jgi:ATP-binding protein involved in chromosome partitioning